MDYGGSAIFTSAVLATPQGDGACRPYDCTILCLQDTQRR